jgi:hypothetical protein
MINNFENSGFVDKMRLPCPDADIEVWSGAGDAPPPVRMNIGLGYTQVCVGYGLNKENKESLRLIGSVR